MKTIKFTNTEAGTTEALTLKVGATKIFSISVFTQDTGMTYSTKKVRPVAVLPQLLTLLASLGYVKA
jgi:hypothetical protein